MFSTDNLANIHCINSSLENNLTVCYYHFTYEFQSESTLYSLPECQGTPCSMVSMKWSRKYWNSKLVLWK